MFAAIDIAEQQQKYARRAQTISDTANDTIDITIYEYISMNDTHNPCLWNEVKRNRCKWI